MIKLAAVLLLAAVVHDVHVSTARAAIDQNSVVVRITVFKNDLESAIGNRLDTTSRTDSLVSNYLRRHLTVSANGAALPLRLLGSGEEKGMKPELDTWHYDVQFNASSKFSAVTVQYDVFFELFHDQRNILKVRLPDGDVKTIFFVPDETRFQLKW